MVVDAQALGSLAAIRSLGGAGYPVVAVANTASAIGLHSRYTARRLIAPSYRDKAFIPWLRDVLARDAIRAIVPSEGFLRAVRPVFDELQSLLPLPQEADKVYAGLSKYDLFETLLGQRASHLPPLVLLDDLALPTASAVGSLRLPVFVKVDAEYALSGTEDNLVQRFENTAELSRGLEALRHRYQRAVVQGYCPGVGVGVFFLRWQGSTLAHFMHRRIHEVPHTGGASSFRAAWFHQAIHDHARALLEKLDWEGVAMVEYRWDPSTDRFWLMELNARFWGSLHLALFAGVDFPRLLIDAFFGAPQLCNDFRRGVASRWTFPREVEYVRSCMKDPALPLWRRVWPAVEFLLLGLDPRVRSDLLYPGDRRLYLRAIRQSVTKFMS